MSKNAEEAMRRARAGPKKETNGNNIPDQEWIKEMLEAGELHSVTKDDRPQGFFDDVIYQWEGAAEEINEEFFEFFRRTKEGRKCNGTAYVRDHRGGYIVDCDWHRIRRPCLAHPARGTDVCRSHGAEIPAVKAAAQRVLAHAAETVAIRLVGLTGTVDEMAETIDHKVRLAAANSVLDRAGIKGGIDVEVQVPGFKKVLSAMFGEEPGDGD